MGFIYEESERERGERVYRETLERYYQQRKRRWASKQDAIHGKPEFWYRKIQEQLDVRVG